MHITVDTLGHLLALHVTPANEQDRDQVGHLAERVQDVCEQSVELAFVDQGYTGDRAAEAAETHEIALEVVKWGPVSLCIAGSEERLCGTTLRIL